jgi:hypothetical protein
MMPNRVEDIDEVARLSCMTDLSASHAAQPRRAGDANEDPSGDRRIGDRLHLDPVLPAGERRHGRLSEHPKLLARLYDADLGALALEETARRRVAERQIGDRRYGRAGPILSQRRR